MKKRNNYWLYVAIFLSPNVISDEIVHQFKSPSFSGIGSSSHYLTIDEQEKTRRDEIAQEVEDALKEAEREAENTTLAKFLRNLESRIYSFVNDGINITLTVIDENGNTTEIIIPVGIFGVCSGECGI